MKYDSLIPFYFLTAFPVCGQSAALNDFTKNLETLPSLNLPEKGDGELKYGIEAVTTWRSEYLYRGFALAVNSMEFQLAGQIALSDESSIDIGFFYGTATSNGDFSELAGFIDYSKVVGKYTYAAKLTIHDYTQSSFESGVDIGASVKYQLNEAFDFTGFVSYDTGAKGLYLETKASYFEQVNDDSYVVLDTGISGVVDYYQRSGFHHAFTKLSYTYNINDSVSISPYISVNLGLHEKAENHLFGGVYFAVSF